jgi:hypothetical protein
LSSVTSGSPHSQEGNLDTEAGPDIADLDGFTEEEFRYDRYTHLLPVLFLVVSLSHMLLLGSL